MQERTWGGYRWSSSLSSTRRFCGNTPGEVFHNALFVCAVLDFATRSLWFSFLLSFRTQGICLTCLRVSSSTVACLWGDCARFPPSHLHTYPILATAAHFSLTWSRDFELTVHGEKAARKFLVQTPRKNRVKGYSGKEPGSRRSRALKLASVVLWKVSGERVAPGHHCRCVSCLCTATLIP